MQEGAKITVSGLVQGVGYRYFCYRKAIELGIRGYAKNLINGSVELEIEGDKDMISEFIKELKIGPLNASVSSVNAEPVAFKNRFSDFRIE